MMGRTVLFAASLSCAAGLQVCAHNKVNDTTSVTHNIYKEGGTNLDLLATYTRSLVLCVV